MSDTFSVGLSAFVFTNRSSNFLCGSVDVLSEDSLCGFSGRAFLSTFIGKSGFANFIFSTFFKSFGTACTSGEDRGLLSMLLDMSSNYFAFASDLSNAFFIVLADFSSEFSAVLFLGELMFQAFVLAMLEGDGSAETFFFSLATFLDCFSSAGAASQDFLQMRVLFSKVFLRSSEDLSYASTLGMSRFFCADNGSNFLAMFMDATFVCSNSLFPFSMLLHARSDNTFLAFFLSFKAGSAGFSSEFLASMRDSSDLVFTNASSVSLLCFLLGFADETSSMSASIFSNIFADVMDSLCVTFLETFILDTNLAVLILSALDSSFGRAFARFSDDTMLIHSLDGLLSCMSASGECFNTTMFIVLIAYRFCNLFARDYFSSTA
jgi:hypothetical protein